MVLRIRYNADVLAGLSILCVAGIGWYQVRRILLRSTGAGLGPALFPLVLMVVITILAFTLTVKGLLQLKKTSKDVSEKRESSFKLNSTILLFALFILYAILFRFLGLLVSSGIFLFLMLLLLKVRVITAVMTTVTSLGAIYLIFGLLFRINLF